MKYLLDTYTLLWAIAEKDKLSPFVKEILQNRENSIFVSSISFWEISLKFSLGKLKLNAVLPDELPSLVLATGFELIGLSAEESATYYKLNITNHRDPFDRMLIWQAIQRNMSFISKDQHLTQYTVTGLKPVW
jgi:PIN domain nuclease of toxin-antitoxin system